MQLSLQLSLPRDERYVPVMRNVAACLLGQVEAPPEAIDDVELALGEACANVALHADGVERYSVSLVVDSAGCEIDVADLGPGLPPVALDVADTDPAAEAGRGLGLMRALMDDLEFSRNDDTTSVRLTKRWDAIALSHGGDAAQGDN